MQDSLEQLLAGESAKLSQVHVSNIAAKYGPIRPQLDAAQKAVNGSATSLVRILNDVKGLVEPDWQKFSLSRGSLNELSFFKFLESIGNPMIMKIEGAAMRCSQISVYASMFMPVFTNARISVGELMQAQQAGDSMVATAHEEYRTTVLDFDKFIAGIYLSTRAEYKRLRRRYMGESGKKETDDPFEENLLAQLFGQRPKQPDVPLGPATALISDNCIMTQLLTDITDSLPRQYERAVPILKKGVATGKTKIVKQIDEGEIEECAGLLIAAAHPRYSRMVQDPSLLLNGVMLNLIAFYSTYLPIARALKALVEKTAAALAWNSNRLGQEMLNPMAIERHYSKINFLAIRPAEEDVVPRTRVERDYSAARTKLLEYLLETYENLASMDREADEIEQYSVTRVREAIELRNNMDEVTKSEHQRTLARNIRDDNEFYISKSGELGSLKAEREPAPKITYDDVVGASFIKARAHVEEVVKVASHPHVMRISAPRGDVRSNLMLIGPYGCHRGGQGILLYDGRVKSVEDIAVGDLIMGPDSTPRKVLRLVRGIDAMAEIVPKKGDPWVVNNNHILTLVRTQKKGHTKNQRTYRRIRQVVDVSVGEYVNWSKTQKSFHPLLRVGVDFPNNVDLELLPIEPYFLGVLLGDGCLRRRVSVTTMDAEIALETGRQAGIWGLSCNVDAQSGRTPSYQLSAARGQLNPLWSVLDDIGLANRDSGDKFVPGPYKRASRSDRLSLLAGLIDTDGHKYGSACYDYVTKSKQLASDIAFIARSLGMAAYVKPCRKKSQNGTEGDYFRLIISGAVSDIPVRIPHKKAERRRQEKNVLHVGFSVRPLPPEQFYGFVVDGDHRYVLDDFTVTHNCGKSEMAKAVASDKRIIGFNLSTADLLTAYMHESVKNVKRMYDIAKDLRRQSRHTKPVGIILDELDRLFTFGEGTHAAYDGPRMEGTLQEMMDGVVGYEGVFLVTLTNLPKRVPEAILRRFKYVDVVGQLTTDERILLFRKFLDRGLPLDPDISTAYWTMWGNSLDNAPGDVIGKVADEIHFKFMSEFVDSDPKKVESVERALGKRLQDREINQKDRDYLKKALASHKTIPAASITSALEDVLRQPQVQMQITKAKETYRDANEIMTGLSKVGEAGLGFTAGRRSQLWTR